MSMQNDRPQEEKPEAAPVQAPAPSADQEEWIPLRDAVKEVASAMAQYLFCNPRECINDAIDLIMDHCTTTMTNIRAEGWIYNEYDYDAKDENKIKEESGEGAIYPMLFLMWRLGNIEKGIESKEWLYGEISFSGTFRNVDGQNVIFNAYACGVEINRCGLPIIGNGTDRSSAPSKEESQELEPLQKAMIFRELRGRPRKWDWEGAWAALVAEAHTPDGLPEGEGAQASIARIMANWFQQKYGEEPADSEIRKRAAAVLEAIALRRKTNFRQFPAISGGQGLA